MEVSVVNVPSNPDAVKRSAAEELARYERQEETKQSEEEGVKAPEADEINIRLTIARAKRQLA